MKAKKEYKYLPANDPNKKEVMYIYAPKEIKQYVMDVAKLYNESITNVVSKMIEYHKTGKKPKFEPREPKYVQAAAAWKQKHSAS